MTIAVVTGGAGFLGQHIIKLLQEREAHTITEIRVVDLKPYKKFLGHADTIPVVVFKGDICDCEAVKDAFSGAEVVFHCAAMISLSYPIKYKALDRVNVQGTQNVIKLCQDNNVKYLVNTSDLCINLTPYTPSSLFAVAVNYSEGKFKVPERDDGFLIRGYSFSKAKADKLVLEAHNQPLANGDVLKTVSLRPTFLYGEGDRHIFSKIFEVARRWNGQIPRIAGDGGKHQFMYVGNAAWAHLCAYHSLKKDDKKIGGLPIFLTDESPIYDITRFANVMCRYTTKLKARPSTWKIPLIITYLVCLVMLFIVDLVNKFVGPYEIAYDPRGLLKYNGSLLYWSRMRASIHMDFDPIYNPETAMRLAAAWYEEEYFKEKPKS